MLEDSWPQISELNLDPATLVITTISMEYARSALHFS